MCASLVLKCSSCHAALIRSELIKVHAAGAIQRFSLGFRGPLCLVCGFTGVAPSKFALGAAVGALGTMPLQILVVGPLSPSGPKLAVNIDGNHMAIHTCVVQSCLTAACFTADQNV